MERLGPADLLLGEDGVHGHTAGQLLDQLLGAQLCLLLFGGGLDGGTLACILTVKHPVAKIGAIGDGKNLGSLALAARGGGLVSGLLLGTGLLGIISE